MTSDCHNLDAYLADDLSADAATQFAKHIEQCATCREAAEQQRWIDSLLRSDEHASLEPVSPAFLHALHTSVSRRSQAARLIACGLAAAAAVAIVGVGWTLKLISQEKVLRESTAANIATHLNPTNPRLNNAAPPRATFVSNGETIAVPIASADADVTIVQLYPTTETERRTRRELALQYTYSESNGGR